MTAKERGPTLRELLDAGAQPWRLVAWATGVGIIAKLTPIIAPAAAGRWDLSLRNFAVAAATGPVIVAIAFLLSRMPPARLHPLLYAALALTCGVALAWLAVDLSSSLVGPLPMATRGGSTATFDRAVDDLLHVWGAALVAWYVFARADWDAERLRSLQLTRGQLDAANLEARVHALQAQIEPHFLFNTLAHVKWLHSREPAAGSRMLGALLDYLRTALPHMRDRASTLGQEVELTRAYLEIQRVRLGARLDYAIQVPAELESRRFPAMMAMTLVENAIKHGIGPLPGGGQVRLTAVATDRGLRVEVADTGSGLRESSGAGLGIANVRARLAASFGRAARLTIGPNSPQGVVAGIEIPA